MRFKTTLSLLGLAVVALAGCTHADAPAAASRSPAPVSASDYASDKKLAISLIGKHLEVTNLTCPDNIKLEKTQNPTTLKYTCLYRERNPEYGQIWLYEAKGKVYLKSRRATLDDLEHTGAYQDPGGELSCGNKRL